jgi:hypothetical protein
MIKKKGITNIEINVSPEGKVSGGYGTILALYEEELKISAPVVQDASTVIETK